MTTFKIHCPNCNQKLEADDSMEGMEAACPKCQQTIKIARPQLTATPASGTTDKTKKKFDYIIELKKLMVIAFGIIILSVFSFLITNGNNQKLADLVKQGNLHEENKEYSKAVECYREAAEKGCAEAQYLLGKSYSTGQGVEKDHKEAMKWRSKAAKRGNANAQFDMGFMILVENSKDSLPEGARWIRKAAEQGHVKAQRVLGGLYYHGRGVKKDLVKAEKWSRKAADQGDVEAQRFLDFFQQGIHEIKKLRNLQKMNNRAELLTEGIEYMEKQEFSKAFECFYESAKQGNSNGQLALGHCYEQGRGTSKDYYEAVNWFQKAAEQGNSKAQIKLGEYLCEGKGVARNYVEAAKWFRKAAEQGEAKGQNLLGFCYYKGLGVKMNYIEAVNWFRKAAEQGDTDAKKILNNLGER